MTSPIFPLPEQLTDGYGRPVTYLRLSITDRCDLRCTYCMSGDIKFSPRGAVMSLEECLRVAKVFISMGLTKVRVTGGEPLVRPNALWLLKELGQIKALRELTLTTNASQLARFAPDLKAAGVKRLNISLDTLKAERFARITRTGKLEQTLRGIAAAQSCGFSKIRLNVVAMKGVNEDEWLNLTEFAVKGKMDIAFIEEMPLGTIGNREKTYIPGKEVLAALQSCFNLLPLPDNSGGPANYWRILGEESRVGFISPLSCNFCALCNRVRISTTGELYPCLGHNTAIPLLPVLRRYPDDDTKLRDAIIEGVRAKPREHDFSSQFENPKMIRFMSMTGG